MDKFTRLETFYMAALKEKGQNIDPGHYLNIVAHIGREVEIARQGRQSTTEAARHIEYAFNLRGLKTEFYG